MTADDPENEGKAASRMREASVSLFLTVVARGIFLATQVIIARSLGVLGFGLFSLAWTVIGVAIVTANLGLPQVCIRFGVWGRALWRTGLLPVGILGSGLGSALVFLLADPIAGQLFSSPDAAPAVRALAPSILLSVMLAIFTAGFKAGGQVVTGIAFASVGMTVGPFLGVAGAFLLGFRDPASYALACSLGLLPGVVLATLLGRDRPCAPAPAAPGERIRFAAQSLGTHSIGVVNMWADRLMVGAYASAVELGLYQAASQLSMVPMMLSTTIAAVHEAPIARAADQPTRSAEFRRAQLLQIHLVVAGCVGGALTAGPWMGLIFGASFAEAEAILAVLLMAQVVRAIGGPTVMTLNMGGAPGLALMVTAGSILLNVGLNIPLINAYGAVGAAYASLIAVVVLVAASLQMCVSRGLVVLRVTAFLGPLASAATMLLAIIIYRELVPGFQGKEFGLVFVGLAGYFLPMLRSSMYSQQDLVAQSVGMIQRRLVS